MSTPLAEFADPAADALPLWLVRPGKNGPDLPEGLGTTGTEWAKAQGFAGRAGQLCLLPQASGGIAGALFGIGPAAQPGDRPARERFLLAKAAETLPKGSWRIVHPGGDVDLANGALGWLFAQYRFTRYKQGEAPGARLVCPDGVDADRLLALAAGEYLARDLINTPASDMGPADLEAAARAVAERHGAEVMVIAGDDLLARNFPMIHAVGRAAAQAPRLIDLRFAGDGPKLTLVGKGVCFDTGGLDIKPPASMGLMKKDMGGAANVLGLADTLARLGLTRGMQLRVLIPAVENAISANAFRPGDVLTSRKGLTVEVNNTDAEGRLVLADALALADEDAPDLLISMATLTGAARVALGPDLPPFFCDDDAVAAALQGAGMANADPIWRMPFWEPYETMIEPAIADLDNAPGGGFAGAITAALFLRRFTQTARHYVHFDIYGWQPGAAPGRPKGGTGQGMRAILNALPDIL
ncbi:leucyl aminopeptidase family protein [Paracoccus shanxieyensis]|uniref:Leucyl aminopeptidase family protein n=1 Tax=Paracoccus shanxieyensis TaxID=2675752 RepID=A0A6L6IXV6_9RHOB|nr:leucyl aminopeptidase family protein [Paracoccus shanxieyensis]MTH65336.1 leucyl aminopeptidase family protein [Paracoccus shanxieyensis]MTH88359.1 leucyl aminopeptidase family protein [Paracoccus shanxieyensis]